MRKVCSALVSMGLFVGVALHAGCGALGFDVAQELPEQKVPGMAINPLMGILPSFFPGAPITVNLQSETAKRGTGPATHAYLTVLSLSATPHGMATGNFDFLTEIHIYVASKDNGALPKLLIASIKPVPRGQTKVSFDIVPNVDLLPYINAGAQITAEATGTQPAMDFTYDGHIVISIRV